MTYSLIATLSCVLALFIIMVREKAHKADVKILEGSIKKYKNIGETLYNQEQVRQGRLDALSNKVKALEQSELYLHNKLMSKDERLTEQRERIKFLRVKNSKLADELLMVSDLIHVKFTALLPDGQPVKTIFKLGLGPCGLHVKSLRWTELGDRYLIDQLCTNGERKQFVYYKSEVVGRIEFRHGKS